MGAICKPYYIGGDVTYANVADVINAIPLKKDNKRIKKDYNKISQILLNFIIIF